MSYERIIVPFDGGATSKAGSGDVITQPTERWRTDLIVMGTHGRCRITRFLLRSDVETGDRASTAAHE